MAIGSCKNWANITVSYAFGGFDATVTSNALLSIIEGSYVSEQQVCKAYNVDAMVSLTGNQVLQDIFRQASQDRWSDIDELEGNRFRTNSSNYPTLTVYYSEDTSESEVVHIVDAPSASPLGPNLCRVTFQAVSLADLSDSLIKSAYYKAQSETPHLLQSSFLTASGIEVDWTKPVSLFNKTIYLKNPPETLYNPPRPQYGVGDFYYLTGPKEPIKMCRINGDIDASDWKDFVENALDAAKNADSASYGGWYPTEMPVASTIIPLVGVGGTPSRETTDRVSFTLAVCKFG